MSEWATIEVTAKLVVVDTNPYEKPRTERDDARCDRRHMPGKWADRGAWIGMLSVVIAIAIAVWMVWSVLVFPPVALIFVGLAVFPYLIIGAFSFLVTNRSAKAVLFSSLTALVITTCWPFSSRDAQFAMMIVVQIPGAVFSVILARIANAFTNS